MKLQTSTDQVTLTQSGIGSIIAAIILTVCGLALAIGTVIAKSPIYIPLIGVALIAFGIFAGWTAQSTTTILRKNSPSSTISKRLIGGATNSHDFDASKTVRVELITQALNDNANSGTNQQQSRRSILKLVLDDNTEVILGEATRNSGATVNGIGVSNFLTPPLQKEAQAVADFLGVPLNAADMSNPITAIQSLMHHDNAPAQPTVQPTQPTPIVQTPTIPPVQPQPTATPEPTTQPIAPAVSTPTPSEQVVADANHPNAPSQ